MRSSLMHRWRLLLAILPVVGSTGTACAQVMPPPFDFSQIDQEVYEFVGQVKTLRRPVRAFPRPPFNTATSAMCAN